MNDKWKVTGTAGNANVPCRYEHEDGYTMERESVMWVGRAPDGTEIRRMSAELVASGLFYNQDNPAQTGANLKAHYADLGVTIGYIGNIEQWGDDRAFRVFTKVLGADGRRISIPVERDENSNPVYDTPRVRTRLDVLRDEVAVGRFTVQKEA